MYKYDTVLIEYSICHAPQRNEKFWNGFYTMMAAITPCEHALRSKLKFRKYPAMHTDRMLYHCTTLQ